jgi:hypothetical protein
VWNVVPVLRFVRKVPSNTALVHNNVLLRQQQLSHLISAMNIKFAFILLLMAFLTMTGCSDNAPHGQAAKTPEREISHDKNKLRLVIRWPGDDFASRQDIETRNEIERLIFERKVGKIISVGTGMGWMDIVVEVKDKQIARSSILEIMRTVAPTQKFTIEQSN